MPIRLILAAFRPNHSIGRSVPTVMVISAISALVSGCEPKMRGSIERNPNATMHYEVIVRSSKPLDVFDGIRAQVDYQVENNSCVPLTPISGAQQIPSERIAIDLQPLGDHVLIGMLDVDALLDIDYFGLGTCRWKLAAAGVNFMIGKGKVYTWLSLDDLRSGEKKTSYFSERIFELRDEVFDISGMKDREKAESLGNVFVIHIESRAVEL